MSTSGALQGSAGQQTSISQLMDMLQSDKTPISQKPELTQILNKNNTRYKTSVLFIIL